MTADAIALDAVLLASLTGCSERDAERLIPTGSVVHLTRSQSQRLRRDRRRPAPLPVAVAAAVVGLSSARVTALINAGELLASRLGRGPWEIPVAALAARRVHATPPGETTPPPPPPEPGEGAASRDRFARRFGGRS